MASAYRLTSNAEIEHYHKGTMDGLWDLDEGEKWWRDRFEFLKEHGYLLRPRFRPDWKPSWLGTDISPFGCEDSRNLISSRWIDATMVIDGKQVALKKVNRDSVEISIARTLSSEEKLKDPDNHCVPILDYFNDVLEENLGFLVMPLLSPFDLVPFSFISECVEFVNQMLRGLIFLHNQNVAHRDLSGLNIMMDADPLFPKGFHPTHQHLDPTCTDKSRPIFRRNVRSLKYYIIDFGISSSFKGSEPRLVLGQDGLDQDVPELTSYAPYDPFLVDIFTLGNVLKKQFVEKFTNIGFLAPLAQSMTARDPKDRPSAEQALQQFEGILRTMKRHQLCRPVRPVDKKFSHFTLMFADTSSIAYEGWIITRDTIARLIPQFRRSQRTSH